MYDSIDALLSRIKDDIGEPIATRYVREITCITTIENDNKKVFLPHHTSKHHYYTQWCFERGSVVMGKNLGIESYTTLAEYETISFVSDWPE